MSFFVAAGISVGVLAGIYAQWCGLLGLLTWAGFVSWACFYAAGGKVEGLKKTLLANLSGVFWAWIIVLLAGLMGSFPLALGVAVVIGAFFMCAQAHISLLAFIPGSFAGCATTFGANLDYRAAALSLIAGALLGYLSEIIAVWLVKISTKKTEEKKAE
ncbi:MAG TPA: DUF1097 domain-containing protein [Anaerovoracaceae bacterium]|nr:DUF1097 domain-containing protein [Anaerovoracaceae bacterium]